MATEIKTVDAGNFEVSASVSISDKGVCVRPFLSSHAVYLGGKMIKAFASKKRAEQFAATITA